MKKILILFLSIAFSITTYAQTAPNLTGVYHAKNNGNHELLLVIDGYSSFISYKDKEYFNTWGGPILLANNQLQIQVEFNDKDKEKVGQQVAIPIEMDGKNIKANNLTWVKQANKKQDLDGLWRITGRDQNGTVSTIQRGDRKTIKLLVDGYFQWIAINPAEKGFYGTGGGTYKFSNSTYAETIIFFSRDNSRVGAELAFKGELKDGQWHHSGKSSKGDPIYEIWSRE
ncbi:hypothetical protein [Sphingobacterium hungaricum]|uniref:Membrane or secreted protein n=1 Tax=Sphingobacterium hungaricum TaxID=2082723 RepID=A0A928UXZ0_9SPHI|nr:hypothetical protein [Sphingobacterium hungaricum]MBE8712847.1 hypothetical protein [Sphingobacterium hungaricum]